MPILAEKYIKKAEPFVKWAGGKSQLLNYLVETMPQQFNNYLEPFVGGGALFFFLYSSGILSGKKAVLIDLNSDLINLYRVIKNKDKLEMLIIELKNGKYKNEEKVFYSIRENEPENDIKAAARMIYLNRTCYNGLYRVNSNGKFNTPFGRYYNPLICDEENLRAANIALKNVKIIEDDFELVLAHAEKGDFIYFDPPYQPISKTANFTGYTKDTFTQEDQNRLAYVFNKLDKKGCKVMLSNSDNHYIRQLYKRYEIKTVKAKRIINCKALKRGEINELIITNY